MLKPKLKALCEECMDVIPHERLQALPDTRTCVRCSRVKPRTEADVDVEAADADDVRHAVSNEGD